ncbi:hypothetical protein GCM10009741_36200 [Kribbella lupini]|uniref:Uncharacterized protein n=1 Tax=Kribbella lupini TaxID=291602 RepID=A0ABP4LUI9_9ACTN
MEDEDRSGNGGHGQPSGGQGGDDAAGDRQEAEQAGEGRGDGGWVAEGDQVEDQVDGDDGEGGAVQDERCR